MNQTHGLWTIAADHTFNFWSVTQSMRLGNHIVIGVLL